MNGGPDVNVCFRPIPDINRAANAVLMSSSDRGMDGSYGALRLEILHYVNAGIFWSRRIVSIAGGPRWVFGQEYRRTS